LLLPGMIVVKPTFYVVVLIKVQLIRVWVIYS